MNDVEQGRMFKRIVIANRQHIQQLHTRQQQLIARTLTLHSGVTHSSLHCRFHSAAFNFMKRNHQEMNQQEKKNTTNAASNAPSSSSSRPVLPPSLVSALDSLFTACLSLASSESALPAHAWSPLLLSPMISPRHCTHYTAGIIRNAHQYNSIHHAQWMAKQMEEKKKKKNEQIQKGKAGKSKKKRKVKNEKGEWVALKVEDESGEAEEDAAEEGTTTPAAVAAVEDQSTEQSTSVDMQTDATVATASSTSSSSPSVSSSSSSSSTPADAQSWAKIFLTYFNRLLLLPPHSALQGVVVAQVPEANESIRGGGFVDFVIKQDLWNTENNETAAEGAAATATAAASSFSSTYSALHPPTEGAASYPAVPLHTATSFTFTSIGTINSVFKLKYGTPRQGTITPSSRATFTLHPSIPVDSLDGLTDYSHIWLVFIFHQNSNKKFHARIEPPRAGGKKIGVFATRTPHRVNPIGLTLAKLDKVEGRVVHLSSVDLIQGTPIIDIKPYHPADCVDMTQYQMPQWMKETNENKPPFAVKFSERAENELRAIVDAQQLQFYSTYESALAVISESVSLDPRPIYVRTRRSNEEVYGYRLDRLNVLYSVDDEKQEASVREIQYVDYGKLLKEQQEEENEQQEQQNSASASSSSASARRLPSSVAMGEIDEEQLTKRFLQQRDGPNNKERAAAAANADTQNKQP